MPADPHLLIAVRGFSFAPRRQENPRRRLVRRPPGRDAGDRRAQRGGQDHAAEMPRPAFSPAARADRARRPAAGELRREGTRPADELRAPGRRQRVPFTVEQFVLMGRYPYLSPFSPVGTRGPRGGPRGDGSGPARRSSPSGGSTRSAAASGRRSTSPRRWPRARAIMLLDEPTTFLDYRHQDEIRRAAGAAPPRPPAVTMVAVTHDVNRAVLESDRIVALARRPGRLLRHARANHAARRARADLRHAASAGRPSARRAADDRSAGSRRRRPS